MRFADGAHEALSDPSRVDRGRVGHQNGDRGLQDAEHVARPDVPPQRLRERLEAWFRRYGRSRPGPEDEKREEAAPVSDARDLAGEVTHQGDVVERRRRCRLRRSPSALPARLSSSDSRRADQDVGEEDPRRRLPFAEDGAD
jgi:hypothetical protein